MRSYDPLKWFWISDAGDIFDSERCLKIDSTDKRYLDFIEIGGLATPWPRDEDGNQTDAALLDVVRPYGLLIGSSPLDAARQAKVIELTHICGIKIIGGFLSSALGDEHQYPSDIKDQINLMGSVTDSIMPELPVDWQTPFWCRDAGGVWDWKMHNAAQIQQAGRDGKAHVVACQTTLKTLKPQIVAAKTVAAVNAIGWPA